MSVFTDILKELNYPRIFLCPPDQFTHIEGVTFKEDQGMKVYGISSVDFPIIAVAPGLKGKVRKNVIYHEIAHHLFPHRPHWWIECFAERMAGGGGRGYFSKKFDKSVDDLPPRNKLLHTAIRATKRFNKRPR